MQYENAQMHIWCKLKENSIHKIELLQCHNPILYIKGNIHHKHDLGLLWYSCTPIYRTYFLFWKFNSNNVPADLRKLHRYHHTDTNTHTRLNIHTDTDTRLMIHTDTISILLRYPYLYWYQYRYWYWYGTPIPGIFLAFKVPYLLLLQNLFPGILLPRSKSEHLVCFEFGKLSKPQFNHNST